MQIDGLMASMLGGNLNGGGGGSGGGSPEAAATEAALSSLAAASAGATPPGAGGIPAALHNLQRLLQSQLAGMNPLQLQQVLQRQQVRKTTLICCPNKLVKRLREIHIRCTCLFGQQSMDVGSKIDCCLRSKQRD